MKITKVLAGTPSLDEFINEWLPDLPQAKQIDTEHAKRWYHIMTKRNDDRFDWHFKRLRGIGGSEIGELAARALGYDATYTQVEHIINQKLMIAPPDAPNNYMRRGILAEKMIASIFTEDYAAKRRNDLIRKIGGHKIGWMAGNPDDVVEIEGTIGGVDYKAATEVPDSTHLIYQAQLQFYDYLLADSLGLTQGIMPEDLKKRTEPLAFDFMVNVFLDYENGVTVPIFVPYSGELMNTMIASGDAVWQHLTKGTPLPEWMLPRDRAGAAPIEMTEAQKSRLEQAEIKIVQLKSATEALITAADAAVDEAVAVSKEALQSDLLKDAKLPLAATSMTVRRSIDKERWQSILNGMDDEAKQAAIEQTSKITTKLDETKVMQLLAENGIQVELASLCKTDFDTDAVANYCLEHHYAPAINESVSLSRGRNKAAKAAAENIANGIKDDVTGFVRKLTGAESAVFPSKEKDELETALGNS